MNQLIFNIKYSNGSQLKMNYNYLGSALELDNKKDSRGQVFSKAHTYQFNIIRDVLYKNDKRIVEVIITMDNIPII